MEFEGLAPNPDSGWQQHFKSLSPKGAGLGGQISLHKGTEEGLLPPGGFPGYIHLSSHRHFEGGWYLTVVMEGVSGHPVGSRTPISARPREQKTNPSEHMLNILGKESLCDWQCARWIGWDPS